MKIHQIRNASLIIESGDMRLLVDPMLAKKHALPRLRLFGARDRNPTASMPQNADTLLESVTHCIITHCQKKHFDHLDGAAKKWLIARNVPVFCTPHDATYLKREGLNIQPLLGRAGASQPFLNGTIQTVPCVHGRGLVGMFMEHGVGYVLKLPSEPTLYLTGDTILTKDVRDTAQTLMPDVIVAPAGGARLDIGGKIIMDADDICALARLIPGTVIANHLEAISLCTVSRNQVLEAAKAAGMAGRILAPDDGETLVFAHPVDVR